MRAHCDYKKLLAVGLCTVMVGLAGCGGAETGRADGGGNEAGAAKTDASGKANAQGKQASAGKDGKKRKVALVCDVAGTQVFILDMIDGLKDSAKKYGFEPVVAECADAAAYEDNCRAMVEEGADLIIGGSWQAGDAISKMATEFPDKADYALIDAQVDTQNVKCISYREQEGAYLVGQMAGMLTDPEANQFGMINVSQGPSSFKWRWGYMEGVKSERPDAKFIFNYVGSYNDPAKAKEYAIQQYEQGCQFVNSAAAGGDKGVFEAAKENGFYTSGQDVDLTTPDNPWIVTCQIKDTYATMEHLLDEYFDGAWNTDNESLGIAEGAIGAVYVTQDSKTPRNPKLTDDDISKLKATADKIKDKEIDLSTVPDEDSYHQ